MEVLLLKPNKIDGKAGDIVDVSEDRAKYLIGFKLAAPVTRNQETPEKKTTRRTTRTKK